MTIETALWVAVTAILTALMIPWAIWMERFHEDTREIERRNEHWQRIQDRRKESHHAD